MTGVIAAGDSQTVQAGARILRQGGNAVDAAVAAAFASFIAESALANIGGGGIAQIYDPTTRKAIVYDFFSTMPGLDSNGATPPERMDFRKILVDFGPVQQPFYIGRGSVAVPGVVAGLCMMVNEKGTLPLSQILRPAIQLAQEGVHLSSALEYVTEILEPILTDTPGIAQIYTPDGYMVTGENKLYFTDLAKTLKRLGKEGPSYFYTGNLAHKIVRDQQQNGGLLTATDLSNYQVFCSEPLQVNYRGYTILLPPPSSKGGSLIAFTLKLLATLSLTGLAPNSFEHLRILTEAMRITNIARAAWEAKETAAEHNSSSNHQSLAHDFLSKKNIQHYSQKLKAVLAGDRSLSEPLSSQGPASTTHISVADDNGLLVSITTSAGENAGFVVDDTGVMMNNMLGEIDLHPTGFHLLPPGQRLMTMMSPTLVLHRGQPILAVGSGGSNRLRTAILQVISNFIDFKLPLEEAVDAPRLHFEDEVLQLEGGIAPEVADQLETAGYTVNRWPDRNMFFGGAHAVACSHIQPTRWMAAGDRRRGGSIVIVN